MTCRHRTDSQGHYCADCQARWDRDDQAPPCPKETPLVPEPAPFVSALAPDAFRR